jgi:putative membrane protein
MLWSSLLSTLHLFAFAIGLPGVFLRGVGLRALRNDPTAVERTLMADNAWGVAALLWLVTGLLRAFGSFEKGSGYYLHSGPFLIKMALVIFVFSLEVWPMVTFIKWRIAKGKGLPLDFSKVAKLARVNDVEVALTVVAPFFASAMARGMGFGMFG